MTASMYQHLLSLLLKANWGLYESKTKQQVREIRNKIINQVERRSQYDSDDEVIAHAVQQFYEDLKQRRILK